MENANLYYWIRLSVPVILSLLSALVAGVIANYYTIYILNRRPAVYVNHIVKTKNYPDKDSTSWHNISIRNLSPIVENVAFCIKSNHNIVVYERDDYATLSLCVMKAELKNDSVIVISFDVLPNNLTKTFRWTSDCGTNTQFFSLTNNLRLVSNSIIDGWSKALADQRLFSIMLIFIAMFALIGYRLFTI
jgi:hypothetical protein